MSSFQILGCVRECDQSKGGLYDTLYLYGVELMAPCPIPNPQTRKTNACLWLHIWYIRHCPLCLNAGSPSTTTDVWLNLAECWNGMCLMTLVSAVFGGSLNWITVPLCGLTQFLQVIVVCLCLTDNSWLWFPYSIYHQEAYRLLICCDANILCSWWLWWWWWWSSSSSMPPYADTFIINVV
jgi:hypothetical protein